MSTIGDSFRGDRWFNVGEGVQLAPADVPDAQGVVYPAFSGGLWLSADPSNLPQECSPFAVDMEATRADRIRRAPGVLQLFEEPHSLRWIFEQASLDYITELVAIDPPWMGFKGGGAWTWVNVGIGATGVIGWNAVNYGGTLIFSNGVNKTYSRASGASVVTDLSAIVVARTFAIQFGRLFAGAYSAAGVFHSLGIEWNSSLTGAYNDFTTNGAGAEELIDQQSEADKVIALRSIGFDLLGILMRKSLWAGYPTGQDNRPADFRPRISGIGCVGESTARATPGGVTFLSDEGVANYNVSSVSIISQEINSELLPLDYVQLQRYIGLYSPIRRRYFLLTPSCMWVYEFPPIDQGKGRWFRRSLTADNMVAFTDQSADVRWIDLVGDWASQILTWQQFQQAQQDAATKLYWTSGVKMGLEDPSTSSNFGTALMPVYQTAYNSKVEMTEVLTTLGYELTYAAGSVSTVRLTIRDTDGNFTKSRTKTLAATGSKLVRGMIWHQATGQGSQLQIECLTGDAEISRVRHILLNTPTAGIGSL